MRAMLIAALIAQAAPGVLALTLPAHPAATPLAAAVPRAGGLEVRLSKAVRLAQRGAAALLVAGSLACADPAWGVSGGGKDFSGQDLEGANFAGKKLVGKEFRGIQGANSNFAGANLASTSFFKADLSGADLSDANLSGASLEDAGLDGANLSGSVLSSAYLTKTIADAKSIRDVDFSEAVMPTYTQRILCDRPDATGTNAKTGVDTRESLMCP